MHLLDNVNAMSDNPLAKNLTSVTAELYSMYVNIVALQLYHSFLQCVNCIYLVVLLLQARALTSQTAESDAIRFLVGTQSLKFDNQVSQPTTQLYMGNSMVMFFHLKMFAKQKTKFNKPYNSMHQDYV